ncbi:hypothetical protein B0H67DRAFT_558718 [Lasiosphaeris hirsuta]|uniref:Uncharacterized protein n=1 Tax=Lasiosphaeris hirsuta TaxID=260670 RepID=A0AA39ZPL0_9PEZI|nr:hypothetical protein B0H67DRAFT_558718 [Lasiosphaeris hirsuta]
MGRPFTQPVWEKDGIRDRDKLTDFFGKGCKLSRAVNIGFGNGKYLELVKDIERDVIAIKTLTEETKILEPVRAERRVEAAAKAWFGVRESTKRMFKALESHWSCLPCPCQSPHVASLKLDMAGNRHLRLTTCDQNEQKFRLLLTFDQYGEPKCVTPWKWKIIEIQPILDNRDCSPKTPVNVQGQGQVQRYGPGPKPGLATPPRVRFYISTIHPGLMTGGTCVISV